MLREAEKKKLNKGMYIRFVLSTKEDIVPAIVSVTGMRHVFYIERTDDGRLMFILSATIGNGDGLFQDIFDVEREINSLFNSDDEYCLDYVTSNIGEYEFRVFGHVGDGVTANMFIQNKIIEDYDRGGSVISEKDMDIVKAYNFVYSAVVDNI